MKTIINFYDAFQSNNLIPLKMKTFFEKLLIQLEFISHPAGGWFSKSSETQKRKMTNESPRAGFSPECYNVRGASTKKQSFIRHTPAP